MWRGSSAVAISGGSSSRQRSLGIRAARREAAARRRVDEVRRATGDDVEPGVAGVVHLRDALASAPRCTASSCWRTARSVGAFSTSLPPYITAISSVWPATTPRSWVTRTSDMLRSRRCSSSRSRICACTVTSSAVVGSSANSSVGPHAMAMAIITRWRMPPDISCGYWCSRRSGSGMRTSCSSRSAVARASASTCRGGSQRLGDLLADLHQRVQRGHRVLEDHRHLLAPDVAHLLACQVADLRPSNWIAAVRIGASRWEQAHDRAGQDRLAGAALADDAERPCRAPASALTPSTARTRPRGVRKWVRTSSSCEERTVGRSRVAAWMTIAHTAASRMSKRRASRRRCRLKRHTVRNSIRHGKIVAHHALLEVVAGGVDHLAPRLRPLDAEAEEGERRPRRR